MRARVRVEPACPAGRAARPPSPGGDGTAASSRRSSACSTRGAVVDLRARSSPRRARSGAGGRRSGRSGRCRARSVPVISEIALDQARPRRASAASWKAPPSSSRPEVVVVDHLRRGAAEVRCPRWRSCHWTSRRSAPQAPDPAVRPLLRGRPGERVVGVDAVHLPGGERSLGLVRPRTSTTTAAYPRCATRRPMRRSAPASTHRRPLDYRREPLRAERERRRRRESVMPSRVGTRWSWTADVAQLAHVARRRSGSRVDGGAGEVTGGEVPRGVVRERGLDLRADRLRDRAARPEPAARGWVDRAGTSPVSTMRSRLRPGSGSGFAERSACV